MPSEGGDSREESLDGRVDRVLDSMPDGVFVTDIETGTVLYANDAAQALASRPVSEVVGSSLREVFPPATRYDDVTERLHERASNRDGPVPVSGLADHDGIEVQRPDGTTVPVELTAATVPLADEPMLVTVVRDVSERRGREQRLSVFTRIFRHNLRNDLSVVRIYAEELAAESDDDRGEMAEAMLSKTSGLLELAAKAETVQRVVGSGTPPYRAVEVAATVRRIAEDVETEHSGATVEVDASPGTTVSTDPGAFEVAVENVVENAVEHADTADPRAWVSVNALSDGVEVVVEDEGPGLPPQERAVLLRGEETQLEHGSGIGLWLVNWAARTAEGDVFFEEGEAGSRVILWFPELEDRGSGGLS